MTTLVLLYMLNYGRREHKEMGRGTGIVTDTLVVNQGRVSPSEIDVTAHRHAAEHDLNRDNIGILACM